MKVSFILGLYNFEVVDENGKPKVVSFRLPSLAQASIYHEVKCYKNTLFLIILYKTITLHLNLTYYVLAIIPWISVPNRKCSPTMGRV